MRAVKYIECSAKTGENVDRVFEEGVRLVLAERAAEEELEQTRKKIQKREASKFAHFMCFG